MTPETEPSQRAEPRMGSEGAAVCLDAGANDLGGTLMNESITRAAGGVHGQELGAEQLQMLARGIGRPARQRTTLYGVPAGTGHAGMEDADGAGHGGERKTQEKSVAAIGI